MKMVLKSMIAAFVTMNLIACGGGGDSKKSSAPNLPTYSEQSFLDDSAKIADAEENLESAGLKFKLKNDYSNGVQTMQASWLIDNIKLNSVSDQRVSSDLESYIAAAEAVINKYSVNFNMTKNNGATEAYTLKEDVKLELNVKIKLCKDTLEKLKQ